MAEERWAIEGKFVEFCKCDVGCPCHDLDAPTQGHCHGVLGMEIDRGHYGDTSLDDVSVVALFYFPGAMHEAGGHLYPILPEGITEPQRDAVLKILGGESQPTGTVFDIFSALIEHEHDPIYRSITFDWHIESRKATLDIPGVLSAEPI